jgi:hypothetical protein
VKDSDELHRLESIRGKLDAARCQLGMKRAKLAMERAKLVMAGARIVAGPSSLKRLISSSIWSAASLK